MPLIQELRRRNVIRPAGLYLVGPWLDVEVIAAMAAGPAMPLARAN